MKQLILGDAQIYFPQDTTYAHDDSIIVPDNLYERVAFATRMYWDAHEMITQWLRERADVAKS